MKYKTIYADPPWSEHGGGKIKRGADRHYPLMKTEDICNLPIIKDIVDDNAHLYLWATNNFLQDAFKVVDAWGYRGITEHCLFCVRGNLPYKVIDGKRQQGVTGFVAPRQEHSRKPDEMRKMIEIVSYEPRVELFARERFDGWDAWGNEI